MTLYLSKFCKDSPGKKIGEVDFTFDTTKHCYFAEFDGIDIPREARMHIHASCNQQGYFSMTVFQGGSNVINLAAALKNYAHAMIQFRSGYYLPRKIPINPLGIHQSSVKTKCPIVKN
jgi:hypothetical protein